MSADGAKASSRRLAAIAATQDPHGHAAGVAGPGRIYCLGAGRGVPRSSSIESVPRVFLNSLFRDIRILFAHVRYWARGEMKPRRKGHGVESNQALVLPKKKKNL